MRRWPLLVGMLIGTTTVQAEDWPQFRGPNCSGVSTTSTKVPIKFSDKENVRWSAKVGDGIGSPVVAAGRVFTAGMTDATTVTLFAFDVGSGRELWSRSWPTGDLADIHLTNSHAATTPAADAERVYFYFSTLGMLCVDARTGADVWKHELPTPFFIFKWGPGMSPVLHDDLLIFLQDDDLYPQIIAFDKRTGEIRWREERTEFAVSYSHPVVCTTDGQTDLVVAGTGWLIGYDPQTGRRRWQARVLLRNIKTTPVALDGVVYIAHQSGGIANQWLASIDRAKTGNSDGKITKDEVQAFFGDRPVPDSFYRRTFDKGDVNRDGALEGEELDRAFLFGDNAAGAKFSDSEPAEEYILAVRGGGAGDVTKTNLLWKHRTKHTDHIVSPLVHAGRMFLVKCGGIATGFDLSSGTSLFPPGRIKNEGNYFASPVQAGPHIYMAGENGKVAVLNAGPSIDVVAVNNLDDPILATPAIADHILYIRSRTQLFAIGE